MTALAPTIIWRVRPSGNNANGGGFDPGVTSPGTDYSQQDGPQVTFNGSTLTMSNSGASATVIVTGRSTFAADVGNIVKIASGTNFIAGFYTIISAVPGVTGVGTWTFNVACTSGVGSAAVGRMGGGWADFWMNTTANIVPGNIVYILGSGMPNPSSYTYDYTHTSYFTPVAGNQTTGGFISFSGDPNTPSSGFPCIKSDGLLFYNASVTKLVNLWFVASSGSFGQLGIMYSTNGLAIGCTFDQFGYDTSFIGVGSGCGAINCEISSSYAGGKRTTNANPGLYGPNGSLGGFGFPVFGNNVHDCIGVGIEAGDFSNISFNAVSKNGGTGILVPATTNGFNCLISNNTVDGNLGNGVEFTGQPNISAVSCFNNIISNHVTAATYGMKVDAGTTAQNDRVKNFIDYNTYYNNTVGNVNTISLGAHDTATGSTPYVSESTNNWTLVSGFFNAGVTPSAALPQRITGWNG